MTTVTELPTGTWQIDPAATTVNVTVKKLGMITVAATLDVASGSVTIDDAGAVAAVDVVADASSYTTGNKKRDEHVASADFLDVANYPTITFTTKAVAAKGGSYSTTGNVTIKGKPSPVEFVISNVNVSGDRATFTATGTADRKALGVDKMPTFVIGQNLALDISATVVRTA